MVIDVDYYHKKERLGNSIGAIGGLLGLGGGASGTGYDKPQQAQIATIGGGLGGAPSAAVYERNIAALNDQQRLLQALQQQGGMQKQTGVFNQLQDVAAGKGPNPAQAMLAQQTGANVANQAALMAGQRGSGANAGLIGRQAAQQGANLQQQAVGQGATMQANQSLGALGQLGGLANTMVANQIGAQGAATGAEQAMFGNVANQIAQENQARVSSQGSVNAGNAGLAQTGMQGQQGLLGGVLGGIGSIFKNQGGVIGYAEGGEATQGPVSSFGQFLTKVSAPVLGASEPAAGTGNSGASALQSGTKDFTSGLIGALKSAPQPAPVTTPGAERYIPHASGGMVDVVLSPGEKVVSPENVSEAAGGQVKAKTVPGQAKVGGDSIKNDTYKTSLPEGSVVVPRTKAGNDRDAAAFVRKVLAQKGRIK